MDGTVLVSLLGALGVGSLVTQWISTNAERRRYRADALRSLRGLGLWAWSKGPDDDEGLVHLESAVTELRAAALIARVPRAPVEVYGVLVQYANAESGINARGAAGSHGSIPRDLGVCLADAADIVAMCIWNPLWSRPRVRSRLAALGAQLQAGQSDVAQRALGTLREAGYLKPE